MKPVLSLRKQVPQGSGDFFILFYLFIKALLFDQHSVFWKKCQLWAANMIICIHTQTIPMLLLFIQNISH